MASESSSPKTPVSDANVACDACGAFGAYTLGERHYCVQCYTERGSCCAEFFNDDDCKVARGETKAVSGARPV